MATAKPPSPASAPAPAPETPGPTPVRRRSAFRPGWRTALLALLALFAFCIVWFWRPMTGNAAAGTAYGARVACSCRYVAGRSLEDCRKDFVSGMGLVRLSEDPKARSVTARVPLFAATTARFREGQGCLLDPWTD